MRGLFCLVVGSRTFRDYALLEEKLNAFLARQDRIVIVSGGAAGADSLAKQYAKAQGYQYIEFPADWDQYGKRAGYIRNRQMHEYISKMPKRGCVVFWDGKSLGTKQNFALAKEFANNLRTIRV